MNASSGHDRNPNANGQASDILIALEDQAVPNQQSQPPLGNSNSNNNSNSNSDNSDTVTSVRSESTFTSPTSEGRAQEQQPQPPRPPPFIRQRDPVGDPSLLISGYSAPPSRSHSTAGISSGYSPTLRSERLSGHPQTSTPYSTAGRNEYYRGGGMDGHHTPFQNHSHPRHHHHHHHDNDSSGTNVMTIDYNGLDAYVTELAQCGLHNSAGLLENQENLKQFDIGNGLDRAASTGSTSVFGGAFRRRSARKASFYSERAPRPPLPEQRRYTFFSKTTGVIQAPSLPMVLAQAPLRSPVQGDANSDGPKQFSELLKDGCFWIDILDPSDADMQMLSRYFHIHPLTIEDISTEEVREKYEVFRNYYFVCFRTFDQDYNSGSYLQPASMYSVVLREGIITVHFRPTHHHLNVLRRLEQFHSHITLTADWINYALLDDITDSFASPIQTIEYEVDSIDELVLLLRENETSDMLRRIGSCRKNVMTISRLLTNKGDVVRGLMKRFDERYMVATAGVATGLRDSSRDPIIGGTGPAAGTQQNAGVPSTTFGAAPTAAQHQLQAQTYQPYRDGEILLYLGDILDHVLTMLQSLYGYEKVLARSHSNYLAQISLEINQLSNKTNSVVGTLTFFASLIVPMTFVAGLWGMNVHVPGQPGNEGESLNWWWGLCGFMGLYCIVAVCFGKRYGLI